MSTNKRIFIPDHEYQERIQNAAKLIEKEHLDVLIVNSNEADYGNARYFFWLLATFLNVPGLPSLHPEMLPLW
mgnify:CR=1 FL=1